MVGVRRFEDGFLWVDVEGNSAGNVEVDVETVGKYVCGALSEVERVVRVIDLFTGSVLGLSLYLGM